MRLVGNAARKISRHNSELNWKKRDFFPLPSQPIILPFAFLLPLPLLPGLRVGEGVVCLVNRQHADSRVV